VLVTNFVEEVYLVLIQEQRGSNAMDGSVPPALIVEATGMIEVLEQSLISLPSPEMHVGNFKVTPKVTVIIAQAMVVGNEFKGIPPSDVFGVLASKFLDCRP